MGDTVSNSQRHTMKQYPSPFKIGDQFTFENKFGKVVLEAIEEPRPVSSIFVKQVPIEHRLTWNEVEQIALISDQIRLQPLLLSNDLVEKSCGFIRHATTSTAGICKVVSLTYTGEMSAKHQINDDMNRGRNRILV